MKKLALLFFLLVLAFNALAENKYIPYAEIVEGKSANLYRIYLDGMNECYEGFAHRGGTFVGNYYSDINEGVMSDQIGGGREVDKVKVRQLDPLHVEVTYLVKDIFNKTSDGDERVKVLVDWAKKGKYECPSSPEISKPNISGS